MGREGGTAARDTGVRTEPSDRLVALTRRAGRVRRVHRVLILLSAWPALACSAGPPATAPQVTTDAAPPPAVIAAGVVPKAGQVGFTGDEGSLRVIDGPASAPAGTRWTNGRLVVDGSDVTLDGVLVRGPVVSDGTARTLRIRGSVVEGGSAAYSAVTATAGRLDMEDTTVRWPGGRPGERWGNGVVQGDAVMTIVRSDLSGAPDGIQNGSDGSRFEQNVIHDLAVFGTFPQNTHNDGIQTYGGSDVVIRNNLIDIRTRDGLAYDGEHQDAAVFVQPSETRPSRNLQLIGNELAGGGYTVRLGRPLEGAMVLDNRFGPTTGAFGSILVDDTTGITRWGGNVNADGLDMPQP